MTSRTPPLVHVIRAGGVVAAAAWLAVLGDGEGIGALIVTTFELEAMKLAAEALQRVSKEMQSCRLFVVVNPHAGELPVDHPALDRLLAMAGDRAGEVTVVRMPRCSAPAWPVMYGMGKPLSDLATMKPQELQVHGYRLGAAARSVSDVVEWLGEWRPKIRSILAAGGMVTPAK
jgi:hypothetical protein